MSKLYPLWLESLLDAYFTEAPPAVGSTDVMVAPVDAGYVYSDSHASTEDVGEHFVGEAVALLNATLTGGVLDADDVTLTGLTQGTVIPALVIFAVWDGGSQLMAYIDSTADSTLPLTARAATASIVWDAAGIFKI